MELLSMAESELLQMLILGPELGPGQAPWVVAQPLTPPPDQALGTGPAVLPVVPQVAPRPAFSRPWAEERVAHLTVSNTFLKGCL